MIVYAQAEFLSDDEELLIAPRRYAFTGMWGRREAMDFYALPAARWGIPPGTHPLGCVTLWTEPAGGTFLARAKLEDWDPDWQGTLVIDHLTLDTDRDPVGDELVERWKARQ